ncbi:MAG: preprotein translocase subunit SecE [Candidatus Tectomicrobia bacterium]|uniref:Preprotein translocase subunit SecE n=1 Tax=Tectimicrobiota bacterium TaxID=2528274 RepID=A0A932I080_UNCTE|nr:preprotein translocase subunit SecE [Candidatus Tectomicrobia bacterium]
MTAKVMDWFRQARQFLLDVQGEAKRVTWLDLKQTAAQTVLALVFVFVVALYLGIVDLALSRIINYLLRLGF